MEGIKSFFWGDSPEKLLKNLKRDVDKECRSIDLSIKKMENEKIKKQNEIRRNVQRGSSELVKEDAKQIVRIKKSIERFHKTKNKLSNLHTIMQQMVSNYALKKTVEKSSRLMATLNGLTGIGEFANTMRHFSMQLQKAGFIEEKMEDTMDAANGDEDDDEEEVEEQVQRVYDEMSISFEAGAPIIKGKDTKKASNEGIDDLQRRLAMISDKN